MRFLPQVDYHRILSRFSGEEQSHQWIEKWLSSEMSLVGDIKYAHQFSGHFDKFTARPEEYARRLFSVDECKVVGGISFFGGDTQRSYVDIIAWTGELDINSLQNTVRAEWQSFNPFALRIFKTVDWQIPNSYTDLNIFIQTVETLATDHELVELRPTDEFKEVHALIVERYERVKSSDPELGNNLFPTSATLLQNCHKYGTLDYIFYRGERAGVLGTTPKEVAFIYGQEISDVVVFPSFKGKGIAAKAQGIVARKIQQIDPNRLLISVIDGKNIASQKTAERVGQERAFEYVFVDI